MSEISKRIDAIIRGGLAPLLKEQGFKKKARNFYREHDGHVDVINVQASQWNGGTDGQFTVNVGVYYPVVSEITGKPAIQGMPKEYDCTVRRRIGSLLPDGEDTWWSVTATSDDEAVAGDLAEKVESSCLPWLASLSSLDALKTFLGVDKPLEAARIALHQGEEKEAKDYLNQSFTKQPYAESRAMAWGKEHGLV